MVLAIGIVLTVIALIQVAHNLQLRTKVDAEALTRDLDTAIRSRMRAYIALLQSGSALLKAHPELNREDFRIYIAGLNVSSNYAGIQGFGYTFRVLPEELKEFEEKARQTIPNFRVWPTYQRSEYHAIRFLEPSDPRNQAALGYDMFTEPVRRATMERARDNAQPALSGRVTLVQEIEGPKQPGFLIYVPIYRGASVPEDVNTRREQLIGFCYAPFRAGDLFHQMLAAAAIRNASFEIYDGDQVNANQLLYEQHVPQTEAVDQWSSQMLTVSMAGHPWTARVWVPRQMITRSPLAAGVLAGGILLSLLLFYLTRAEGLARQEAEQIATRLLASEQALRRSNEDLRLMIQSARDYAIFSLNAEGRISSWNAGAERVFGYPEAQAMGKDPALLFTPEDQAQGVHAQELERAASAGVSQGERWQMRRDGGRFYASRVIHPISGSHGTIQGYLTIARDITPQMEARERLVREKEFSEAIISSLPGLFLVLDEQSRLRRWNRAVELITARNEPELQGLEITNLVIQEDRERLAATIKETFENGGASAEITLAGAHGQATPFLFTGSRAHLNESLCVIGIGLDISERKAVERSLQEAQRQLKDYATSLEQRVSERTAELHQSLSSLEGVLYHVAHDLRAPLRAMGSFTSILLEEYAQAFDERGRGYAQRITDAVRRMDELLLDLLAYGRLAHMDLPIIRLNLEEQVKLVIGRMSDRIHRRGAQIEVVPPFGQVCANQPVLLDVLGHLLSNALKFVPADTPPQIRIWADDGPMIRVWVQDNGIGIRPEYHHRVFRIFERLHADGAYSGTGIGLAIVQKGVERMHGRVGLESEVGKGSCFWIELPRASS